MGESNTRLTARLEGGANSPGVKKFLARMLQEQAAEADLFEAQTSRKGVCPRCNMQRSCGIARNRHTCW